MIRLDDFAKFRFSVAEIDYPLERESLESKVSEAVIRPILTTLLSPVFTSLMPPILLMKPAACV